MFPRLGRRASDGSFSEASPNSPPLSSTALLDIVKPIMRAAGVGEDHAHPHVLRHTFATLYLARRGHRADALVHLQTKGVEPGAAGIVHRQQAGVVAHRRPGMTVRA